MAMVNQLASNPWIIAVPSDSVLHDGAMPHVQIEYVDYDNTKAIPDHVEIQDRMGNTVAYLKGKGNGETVRTGRIGWVYGLKVPVTDSDGQPNMPSGRLILYYE